MNTLKQCKPFGDGEHLQSSALETKRIGISCT
jgi:hypothetical protein